MQRTIQRDYTARDYTATDRPNAGSQQAKKSALGQTGEGEYTARRCKQNPETL